MTNDQKVGQFDQNVELVVKNYKTVKAIPISKA